MTVDARRPHGRRRLPPWVIVVAVLAVGAAVVVAWFVLQSKDPPAPAPVATRTTPAPPPATSVSSLDASAAVVQAALNSGDDATISDILPLAGSEKPDPNFAATTASLELVLDTSTQTTLAADLWEVQARDKHGMYWTLGILQVDGAPKLIYAERTLP